MVLGILTSIAACPAIIGTTEAVRSGQNKNAKEKHRGVKSNLIVGCFSRSKAASEINGCSVILRDNKLYVASPDATRSNPGGHLFAGYFLPFPEENWGRKGEGMVTTISDDPPQLNWVYMDSYTCELKYGLRVDAEPNIVGPWTVTPVERRTTLVGWEGFMAVKEEDGAWALYFDYNDDGLTGFADGKKKMEVELTRRERRVERPDDE